LRAHPDRTQGKLKRAPAKFNHRRDGIDRTSLALARSAAAAWPQHRRIDLGVH
jgi:hypothetical protein